MGCELSRPSNDANPPQTLNIAGRKYTEDLDNCASGILPTAVPSVNDPHKADRAEPNTTRTNPIHSYTGVVPRCADGPIKVVLLGESGAGKTSIVSRLVDPTRTFLGTESVTVGAAFSAYKMRISSGNEVNLEIWDTAGQERYANLAPLYYRAASCALVCFDVTSLASFERAKFWISELKSKATDPMVVSVVGNKIDLREEENAVVVSTEEAEKYADEMGMLYCETSAKTGQGVLEVFTLLADKAVKLHRLEAAAAAAAAAEPQQPLDLS